jgi:hypothetical protein
MIRSDGEQVSVLVQAERTVVAEAMRPHLGELQQRLEAGGLRLSGLEIVGGQQGSGGNSAQPQTGQPSTGGFAQSGPDGGDGSGGGAHPEGARSTGGDDPADRNGDRQTPAAPVQAVGRSRLDVTI